MEAALNKFFEIREIPGLKKNLQPQKHLIGLNFLIEDLDPSDLKKCGKNLLPKLHGALLKNEQDIQLFEQIAFMSRNKR